MLRTDNSNAAVSIKLFRFYKNYDYNIGCLITHTKNEEEVRVQSKYMTKEPK